MDGSEEKLIKLAFFFFDELIKLASLISAQMQGTDLNLLAS